MSTPVDHADVDVLRRSLEQPGDPVELRETHCSTVLLAGDRAYKLRRPVRFDFVDLTTQAARAQACRREVQLNATLAPGVVLGTLAVVPAADGDGYALVADGDPRAVDHVVVMRRFDERQTMRALLARGALTAAQAAAVGARLARFHHEAARPAGGVDHLAVVHRNLEALAPLLDDVGMTAPERLELQRAASAFLLAWADVLRARTAAGTVVDGHGDLRAEHVLFQDGEVLLVDRLEYDGLRVLDVADELAFLLTDLADLGAGDTVAAAVLSGYAQGGGEVPPDALLAFFGAYRAQVRAKVALLRARQPQADAVAERAHAARLLGHGRRLSWRARGGLRIAVTGPPASGKSTLARALADASGLPLLRSDAVRRTLTGDVPAYALADRAAVYAELGRRAARLPAVVVDATFGAPALQHAFTETLSPGRPACLVVVQCHAPAGEREARAQRRAAAGEDLSEADAAVARDLGGSFTTMDGPDVRAWTAVDTRLAVARQVDAVTAWLDTLLLDDAPRSADP